MEYLPFEKYKKKVIAILKKNGVCKAALFGSFACGKVTKSSDIDLLIQFKGKKSLLDLVGLKLELEKSTNRSVDLVTYNSLHPLLKEKILAEQIVIL